MQIFGFADNKLIMTNRIEFVSGWVDELWEVEGDGYQFFLCPRHLSTAFIRMVVFIATG